MDEIREEQINLRDYLRVIVKRRWMVITVFAIIVTTVALFTLTAAPIYKATARLIIEKENPKVLSIQEVMGIDTSGDDYYQTQYKMIESRIVAREVIKRLHLDQSEEFSPPPKDDPISNLKRSIWGGVASWKDAISPLLRTGKELTSEGAEEYEPDASLVSGFVSRIEVSPIRNSRLVDVGFHAKDPVLATRIVNTLASAYIDENLKIKLVAAQDAIKWLDNSVHEERQKVEQAEQALLRYKEEKGIVTDFASDVEQIMAQKLAQLNAQVLGAEAKRLEAETRYKQASASRLLNATRVSFKVEGETRYKQASALIGSPDMLDSIPEVFRNALILHIKSMEVELYKRMSKLSEKYGSKHPQMVAIQSELKTLQKREAEEVNRVINCLHNEYSVALAMEKNLKAGLAKQKQESLALNQKSVQYGVLKREAEGARNMYELLIKRFKETTLTEDIRTGNIRIIDGAEVPKEPVKPKKKLNLLLAVMVGLTTGIGLAFFFEYLDNTIKIPEDVKEHLKIPYLGPIPLFETENEGNPGSSRSPELVTVHFPKSTASESYRGIRTSVLFSSAESAPQVILVGSAGPREGKSITTANLAVAMAQSDSQVLVLDCDMRRPKMHKVFDVPRDRGMSNLLVGNSVLEESIFHTHIPNLDIIPCGPIPPNPSEILGSNRMASLLGELRKRYTRILIDSPPVTAVTDAVVLSKFVDGVVLVIRVGDMAREIVRNGVEQFRSVGAHILGAVLNGIDLGRDKYYYYYYQYYHDYYGEDGEKKKSPRKKRKKKSKSRYGEEAQGT